MPLQLTGSKAYIRPQPVPKMPPGLVELMEGMTREVLKHNPPDVYEFCAKHMEQLIIIRDGKAPKRYKLTLEQKIRKVQENLKESADLRRHLYDEAVKKINREAIPGSSVGLSEAGVGETDEISKQQPKNNIVSEQKSETEIKEETEVDFKNEGRNETNQEPINNEISESKSPASQEVKNFVENMEEGKLKTPVHHEKELAEALEVEIFHKPLGNSESKNEAIKGHKDGLIQKGVDDIAKISKEGKICLKKDAQSVKTGDHKDKILANGIKVIGDKSATVKETEEHPEVDKKTILLEQDASKTKKGSDLDQADQDSQELDNQSGESINQVGVSKIVSEKPNGPPEQDIGNVQKVPENQIELIKENSGKELDETKPNENNETEASHFSLTAMKDDSKSATQTLDKAASFATEIEESFPIPENVVNAKQDDGPDKTEQDQISNNEKEVIVNETDEIRVENMESGDDTNQNDKILSQSENPPKSYGSLQIVNTENNTKMRTIPTDNAKLMLMDSKLDSKDGKEEQKLDHLSDDSVNEQTLNESALHEAKDIIEQKSVYNNDMSELSHAATEKENELTTKTKGIYFEAGTIQPLSEESNKEESFSKNDEKPISGPSENLERKSSTKGNNIYEASRHSTAEITSQEVDSAPNPSLDEEVVTGHKVLVEETSNVKDGNDAAPTETFKNFNVGTSDSDSLHLSDNFILNESESSETNIPVKRLLQEISVEHTSDKKDDQALDVQEAASTTSEPTKTETSSIEDPNSLEENIFEEGIGSTVDVKNVDRSPESAVDNQHSMDLETAAITIQKVFRSFLFKRSTFDETGLEGANSIDEDSEKVEFPVTATSVNKERRTLGISRMDTVLQTVNEEKSLSLSTDDSSLSSAATIIQAHVRGFLVRNRLSSTKTNSASLGKSEGPSISFEANNEPKTNKTVLNIHIVPEGEHLLSRDESVLTSADLSLDGSPTSSTNLHPLGYDKNEPRKQLKREDAIQSSITPPSNNSGKLSEDVESVKGMSDEQKINDSLSLEPAQDAYTDSRDDSPTKSTTVETVIDAHRTNKVEPKKDNDRSLENAYSDESDVVCEDKGSTDSGNTLGLLHSGEFHDIVLPTKVYRSDTTVVREFKNVLVYFLLWNNTS